MYVKEWPTRYASERSGGPSGKLTGGLAGLFHVLGTSHQTRSRSSTAFLVSSAVLWEDQAPAPRLKVTITAECWKPSCLVGICSNFIFSSLTKFEVGHHVRRWMKTSLVPRKKPVWCEAAVLALCWSGAWYLWSTGAFLQRSLSIAACPLIWGQSCQHILSLGTKMIKNWSRLTHKLEKVSVSFQLGSFESQTPLSLPSPETPSWGFFLLCSKK